MVSAIASKLPVQSPPISPGQLFVTNLAASSRLRRSPAAWPRRNHSAACLIVPTSYGVIRLFASSFAYSIFIIPSSGFGWAVIIPTLGRQPRRILTKAGRILRLPTHRIQSLLFQRRKKLKPANKTDLSLPFPPCRERENLVVKRASIAELVVVLALTSVLRTTRRLPVRSPLNAKGEANEKPLS